MFIPQMSKMDFDQIKPFEFKTEERSFTINFDDSAKGKEMVPVSQKNGMDEDEDKYFPEKKNKNSFRKRKKHAVLNADEGVNLNQALRMNGINSKPLYKKPTQAQKKERHMREEYISFFEVDPGDPQLPPPLPIDDLPTSDQSKRLSGKSPTQLDMFQDGDFDNFGKCSLKGSFNSNNSKDKYSCNDRPSNSTNKVQERDAGFKSYSKLNRQQNDETDGYYNYRPFNTYCGQQKQQKKQVGYPLSHEKESKSHSETDDYYYSNSSYDKTLQSAANNERQPPISLVHSGQQNRNPELAAIFTILRIATEKKLRAKKGKKKAKEISSNMDLISLVQTALIDSDSDSDSGSDRDSGSDDSHRKHKHRTKKSKSRSHKSKGKIKSSKKIKHYYSSDNESSDLDSSSNSDYRSKKSLRKREKEKARKLRCYTSTSEFESSESESEQRRFRKKNRDFKKEKEGKSSREHSSKSRKYFDSESEEESSKEKKPRRKNKNKQERHNSDDLEEKLSKLNLNNASNHDIIIEEMESDDNKTSSFKKQMLLTYGNDNSSENEEFDKGEKKKQATASRKVNRPNHIDSADATYYEAKKPKKATDKSKKSKIRSDANSSSEDFTNCGDKAKKLKSRSKSKQNSMDSEDGDVRDYEQKKAKTSKLKSKSSKSKSKSRSKPSPLHSDSESFTDYDEKRSKNSKFKFKSKPNPIESDGEGLSDYKSKRMRRPEPKLKANPLDTDSESFTDYNEKKLAKSRSKSKFKSKPESKPSDGDDSSDYEANKSKKSRTKTKYERKAHSSSDFTSDDDIKHKKSKGKSKTPVGSDSDSGSDSEFYDYEKKNGIGDEKWKRKGHSTFKTKSGS